MHEEQSEQVETKPTKDERTWAMLCHFSAFFIFLPFPFSNILAPLIIWLIKKEEMPLLNDQGKEVVNFQLTMTICIIISALFCIILIGIPFLIGFIIYNFIMTIILVFSIMVNN